MDVTVPEVRPLVPFLRVAVEIQLLLHHEQHRRAMLRHCLAVCTRGVGELRFRCKYAGPDVLLRTRAVELQKLQLLRRVYKLRRRRAEDDICRGDVFRRCAVLTGV